MGLNSDHSEVAYSAEVDLDYEDEEEEDIHLGPEDWHDWNSEHLLNMWMSLQQYLEDNHLKSTFLRTATFHSFAEYVRQFSR